LPMAGCSQCKSPQHEFAIAMAFQPIVDCETGTVFAYEALVRGENGESAGSVLSQVDEEMRYAFDQQCRVTAIEDAVKAGILETDAKLSINFLPNAVYSPLACIQLTLATARACDLPTDRLLFELTENERMDDTEHVRNIVESYKSMGFSTAIDDFGAGHAGLGLLAKIQTDYLKLDMELIRSIDSSVSRRVIVQGIVRIATRLGITVCRRDRDRGGVDHAQAPGHPLLPRIPVRKTRLSHPAGGALADAARAFEERGRLIG